MKKRRRGSDLTRMTRRLLAFRRARDWEQFHNPKDMALSLSLEVAELLELMQWRNGPALLEHLRNQHAEVADELSDILGWVLLLANDLGIDLERSFAAKVKKNGEKYPVDKVRGRFAKYTAYRTRPGRGS